MLRPWRQPNQTSATLSSLFVAKKPSREALSDREGPTLARSDRTIMHPPLGATTALHALAHDSSYCDGLVGGSDRTCRRRMHRLAHFTAPPDGHAPTSSKCLSTSPYFERPAARDAMNHRPDRARDPATTSNRPAVLPPRDLTVRLLDLVPSRNREPAEGSPRAPQRRTHAATAHFAGESRVSVRSSVSRYSVAAQIKFPRMVNTKQ